MCEFCRGYHAKPAEGYFSLSPGQPIITDPIERLWKGDTFKDDLTPASGYAVIVDGKMRHLGKVPLARARQIAMKSGDTATIAAAVGFSDLDVLVWRNVEIIDRTKGGLFVGDDGELMRKMSPFEQIEDMTDVYADKLKTEYSKWAKGQMDEYFSHLDVNWYDVDDVEAVFASAGDEAITDKKDVDRLSNAWGASALIYTTMAASQAREFTKSAFLPKIGSSISTGDRQAMKFLSDQPGFFVRDHLGRVDAGLTKAGKAIVNRGIRDGIGYQEIGKELREQLPGMWGKYGANYSNVVANAGVQRSRAFAEITSYVEAGIEFAELIAVLDQRTTDTCFLGETMVSTPTGQKRIDSIKIGDLVVTASGLERKVIGTQRRWANNLCEIIFSNGLKLFVTGNHSIVTEGGWKKSEELKENDRVAVLQATTPKKKAPSTIADTVGISQQEQGKEGRRPAEFYLKKTTDFITVKSTMRLGRYYEVFNLEVDEDHTYLAENIQVSNCRMLDGQIIRVDSIVDILNQTLEIENPEEIREVSPWISTKKNPSTGVPQLVTRNGVVLADIVRSGYGKIDDRGQFAARLMGDQLAVDASIGPPPYHAYCRTTMNPVVKTFQVPPKTWRVAIPTTPLNPKEANPITTPSFLRGLTAAAYVNSIGAADRGYMTGRNPTVSRHVSLGMPGDPEAGVWGEDGWIDSMDAREQVERRVSNSLSRLSNAL
ncbi:MAG: hypothetical protein GY841_15880, partial [FCB group bacterium]|nr:hypothetical protein [FCB group bacterium]